VERGRLQKKKTVAFLYTIKEQAEKNKICKTIPFTIPSNK
jgi:hypothetical protein